MKTVAFIHAWSDGVPCPRKAVGLLLANAICDGRETGMFSFNGFSSLNGQSHRPVATPVELITTSPQNSAVAP